MDTAHERYLTALMRLVNGSTFPVWVERTGPYYELWFDSPGKGECMRLLTPGEFAAFMEGLMCTEAWTHTF